MTLKINTVAPDFKANTQLGDISFHEWLGDSWGVLFSHQRLYQFVQLNLAR